MGKRVDQLAKATEEDLVSSSEFLLDTDSGTKGFPADLLAKKSEVLEFVTKLIGDDENYVSVDLTNVLIPNIQYTLTPSKTIWNVSKNIKNFSVKACSFYMIKEDDSRINIIDVGIDSGASEMYSSLEEKYTFTIPEDVKQITLGIRAVKGEVISFGFAKELKSVTDLKNEVDNIKRLEFDTKLIGDNENYVSVDITNYIVKGSTYKVVPAQLTWEVAENTKTYPYYGFQILITTDGVKTYLAEVLIDCGESALAAPLLSEYVVTIPNDADSVVIGGRAIKGKELSFNVQLASTSSSVKSTNINDMYPSEEVLPKIGTLKKQTPANWSPENTPMTLLWFSDVHGDVNNVKRIVEFKNKYQSFIDDVLNCGDSVSDNLSNYSSYEQILANGGDKFLVVLGNHDVTSSGSNYKGWDGTTPISDIYEKFVGAMDVEGVVKAGTNKNYYYKDYTSGVVSSKAIRLIVLDSVIQAMALNNSGSGVDAAETTDYEAEQLTWLQGVLSDAITNNLAVVIASHATRNGEELESKFGFTSFNAPTLQDTTIISEDICNAVDLFIANDGEFICWLAGHSHADHIATIEGHSNQIQIRVNTATARSYYAKDSQPYRTGYNGAEPITKTTDAFNLISFDTYNKRIKIVRIGCNHDAYGRPIDMLTFDYANKKILT